MQIGPARQPAANSRERLAQKEKLSNDSPHLAKEKGMRNNESSLQHRINALEHELANAVRKEERLFQEYSEVCLAVNILTAQIEELRQQIE